MEGDASDREKQKQQFLSGENLNPTLDYPEIDKERLSADEAALLQLKRDVISGEPNEVIRQLYRWKINVKIAEVRMLRAAKDGDMIRFRGYSEFIYGKPSLEIFAYTIQNIRSSIKPHLSSEDPDIKKAAEELADLLPSDLPKVSIQELPSDNDIATARAQTLLELGDLINIEPPEEGKQYAAEEIRDIFQEALNALGAEGWSVVVDTGSRTAVGIDQEHKVIKVPESRRLAFAKLQKLVAHEVGTHVTRRVNGERSRLQLLGLGFDRYEKGEEGVAATREQALDGKVEDFSGLLGHLAIGLAKGLDGQPRDFRGVYEIMEKYFYLEKLVSGKNSADALAAAQRNAWKRCVRTFRGTNCATRGVCLEKDIIYREGNIGVWAVIRENPEELLRFRIGKYDPANPRHIWILNQLGISDNDLEELSQ